MANWNPNFCLQTYPLPSFSHLSKWHYHPPCWSSWTLTSSTWFLPSTHSPHLLHSIEALSYMSPKLVWSHPFSLWILHCHAKPSHHSLSPGPLPWPFSDSSHAAVLHLGIIATFLSSLRGISHLPKYLPLAVLYIYIYTCLLPPYSSF